MPWSPDDVPNVAPMNKPDKVDSRIIDRVAYINGKPHNPVKPTVEQYAEWDAMTAKMKDMSEEEQEKFFAEIKEKRDAMSEEDGERQDQQFLHYQRMRNLERLTDEQRCCMDKNGIYVGPPCPIIGPDGKWVKFRPPTPNY